MNTYYGNNTGIEILGANTGHGNYVGHPAWSKIMWAIMLRKLIFD